MDDYLAKPVTRAELERCVHRWWRPKASDVRTGATAGADPVAAPAQPVAEPVVAVAPPEPDAPAWLPPETAPVIDRVILDELREVLGGEIDRLITLFLEDTPLLLARLEAAALAPDYHELREAAHSLKSSSANLGAMALSAAAKRVELGARLQTLDRPAVAVALIASEFARVSSALQNSSDDVTASVS
jgi:HPt (histidine-containing phosphotransfer) domain-containing protein